MFLALISCSLSETRPSLIWQQCTRVTCTPISGSVTSDANWRGNPRNSTIYYQTIGVTASGNSLSQQFVVHNTWGDNVGSRLFLLAPSGTAYQLFKLINREFTYDVDLSGIPCGINAALYTVEMPEKGSGVGAVYGDGYCDGKQLEDRGCAEFDFAESNRAATFYKTRACKRLGQFNQTGQCDANGCGFNPYRYDQKFYGYGSSVQRFSVNTNQRFTVVTQFISSDGTDAGDLTEVRRLFIQSGRVIKPPKATIGGESYDSITDDFCKATGATVDAEINLKKLGESLKVGHVLVFSLRDSVDGMPWLDAGTNGPCTGNETSSAVRYQSPSATVTYSSLKYGVLDSTY